MNFPASGSDYMYFWVTEVSDNPYTEVPRFFHCLNPFAYEMAVGGIDAPEYPTRFFDGWYSGIDPSAPLPPWYKGPYTPVSDEFVSYNNTIIHAYDYYPSLKTSYTVVDLPNDDVRSLCASSALYDVDFRKMFGDLSNNGDAATGGQIRWFKRLTTSAVADEILAWVESPASDPTPGSHPLVRYHAVLSPFSTTFFGPKSFPGTSVDTSMRVLSVARSRAVFFVLVDVWRFDGGGTIVGYRQRVYSFQWGSGGFNFTTPVPYYETPEVAVVAGQFAGPWTRYQSLGDGFTTNANAVIATGGKFDLASGHPGYFERTEHAVYRFVSTVGLVATAKLFDLPNPHVEGDDGSFAPVTMVSAGWHNPTKDRIVVNVDAPGTETHADNIGLFEYEYRGPVNLRWYSAPTVSSGDWGPRQKISSWATQVGTDLAGALGYGPKIHPGPGCY